jgi:hypothetical protein
VRLVPVAIVVLAGATVLGGCAQPGYDARKIQRELQRAGVPADQARCVTEGLERTFDVRQLASRSEPTAPEQQKTRALLAQCEVIPQSP